MAIADADRPYGKVLKGHTVPYGTLADASYELRQAYYYHGYLRDEAMPELPCLPIDGEYVDPEEELSKKEMVDAVREVLDTLPPREAKVLCLRFGIGLTQDYTLEEVGTRFDVTRERIRQIEAKALRHIKHPYRSDKLRALFGYYQTASKKEADEESVKARWEKARENARLRDEAQRQAILKHRRQVEEEIHKADRALREKWEEIKPMVSDTDWVEHLETENPAMYQELKYMVGDIWGKNARIVWEMYAKKK